MIKQIISGGQTGADIAAIDAAIFFGCPYGGMLPKDRICENGIVSLSYTNFDEAKVNGYLYRTQQNVKNSDGALLFCAGKPTGVTKRTIDFAKQHNKPYFVIDINQDSAGFGINTGSIIPVIKEFIKNNGIRILNVAGSRESKTPGIYKFVYRIILRLLLTK